MTLMFPTYCEFTMPENYEKWLDEPSGAGWWWFAATSGRIRLHCMQLEDNCVGGLRISLGCAPGLDPRDLRGVWKKAYVPPLPEMENA